MSTAGVRRALRVTAELLLGIVLMLVLLAGALWWWSGTEGSLDWTLRRLARSQPLTLEGVTGSLRSGLRVQKMVWEQGGLRVEAQQVHLEWQPVAMLSRTLQLDEVDAARVIVRDQRPKTGEPLRPPQSLGLPLRIQLRQLAVGELQYEGTASVNAGELRGAYGFDGLGHQLRVDSLRVANGRYRGEASVGAVGSMPVATTLQGTVTTAVPGSSATLPLAFRAQAQGTLRELRAQAQASALGAGADAPQASVTARITPFEPQPVPEAFADLRRIDVGAFWPQAPATSLSGHVRVAPRGTASWVAEADLRNASPGAWDAGRLPVERVQAEGTWRDGVADVPRFEARAGGGTVAGSGRWSRAGWSAQARLDGVDPKALYSTLASQPVRGRAEARERNDGIDFDVDLLADGAPRGTSTVAALALRQATARGRWGGGELDLPALLVRTSDAVVRGNVRARPADKSGAGQLRFEAPGARGNVRGELSAERGQGQADLDARDLGALLRWLRSVPGVPPSVAQPLAGQAGVRVAWQGGWRDPSVRGRVETTRLLYGTGTAAWELRDAALGVDGRLADAALTLQGRAQQGQRRLGVDVAGRAGGQLAANTWRAQFARLNLSLEDPVIGPGAWRVDLRRPFEARYAASRLDVGAGEAALHAPTAQASQAVLAWSPVRWGGGELQTAGRITGLPMAWMELFGGGQLAGSALAGNLVFDGRWDASLGRTLRIDAGLARTQGDVTILAENAEGRSTRVAAGVREARITLQGRGDNVTLDARWDSERAGTLDARIVTRLASGGSAGWQWPETAPLGGMLRASLPRIGVWSLLAPPGWRLRGSLTADIAVGGTRASPQFSGTLSADELGLRSVVDGIELRDGRLRARLDGQRLRVEEFTLRGAGDRDAGGLLRASGEGFWTANGPELQAIATVEKLRASIRPDRDITVSGNLDARIAGGKTTLRGRIVADQARIQVPEETAPRLGEDVVVRNAPGAIATAEQRKKREAPPPADAQKRSVDVDVALDLGRDFRVTGRGIDTRVRGTLMLAAESFAEPRLTGSIYTVGGEFRAYNQQLDIERGVLRFTGPLDNPALDVLAVRPRLEQKVGVLVTGRAQSPVIRLYSEPEMPDAEKLALLVTGRSSPGTGAEAALVQQAALALLAARRGPSAGGGFASKLGLDALSVRRDASEGAIVSLGKRFSRNFYASYERSLSGALGTLFIFYDISRRLTVRAQAGERTAVDLIFTFRYE